MKAKAFLPLALAVVAVGTSVAAIAQVNKQKEKKDVATTALSWEVGSINESTGKKKTDESQIRSKDYFSIAGFEVDVNDDEDCSFTLYLYDKDKNFLGKTTEIKEDYVFADDYAETNKDQVSYAKVVIDPDDEDITLLELARYVKNYDVSVKR